MENLFDTIKQVLNNIEYLLDSHTNTHEIRVGKLMGVLAKAYGLSNKRSFNIEKAGAIHDIGKLALSAQLLNKPSSLNNLERKMIEQHTIIGKKMLKNIDHPLISLAGDICISHHEAYDATGYPYGLQKQQIPLEARICSICDVYDAIRSSRPYHPDIIDHQSVIQKILSKKSGDLYQKFDPELLEVFSEIHLKFDNIFMNAFKHSTH